MNEEDYNKTLTSEDDINTLEPGTYKIVKEDMPQNAPIGVANSEYDGTLIISNSYAILIEYGFLHIGNLLTDINKFIWNYVINSNLINIHLQYYMLISKYSDGEYIDDIHILNQNLTGVFIVNSTTQNLPVQQNGIIIVRLGTATNSLFVTFIPEDSFDVYHCAKKSDGTWTEWEQVAFLSDVPSLTGYATQEWVKSNAWTTGLNNIPYNDLNDLVHEGAAYSVPKNTTNAPGLNAGYVYVIRPTDNFYIQVFFSVNGTIYTRTYSTTTKSFSSWFLFVSLPYLNSILASYATKTWVNHQIQDITGGSVTADWVKANYYALTRNQYTTIAENTDYNKLKPGCYFGFASNFTNSEISSLEGELLIIKFHTSESTYYRSIIYNCTKNKIYFCTLDATELKQIAYSEDIPSLSGYATQTWVQSQNYLTEIPDEYATDTEVARDITVALVGYATQTWVNQQKFAHESDIPSLSEYATQTWVNQQGFAKEDDIPSLNGYATQTWVNQQGFLTEIPEEYVTLTELQAQNYATQSWVNSQGFIKGNMTLYTTVDQLDISYPTTTLNVFKAMSNNSLLIFGTDTTYITDLPVNSGILEITKVSNIRYKIVLYKSSGGTIPVNKGMYLATTNSTLDNLSWEAVVFTSDLNNYATEEWVGQQGYQTVQQVNSLINTATADMLTQTDLNTFNYATENWVLQTALVGYATENWVNTKLSDYLPKTQEMSLTTQGTYYGLQYQWTRYGQVVEVFLVGNLTQEISNQLISDFCPANPMGTLQVTIAGYDSKTNYAEFNGNGLKLMGTYSNELYVNCHFTYLTNE